MFNGDSGIYLIENIANGKCYVGSSRGIRKRWWEHRRTLRLGEHGNAYLQRAWKAAGGEAFRFVILEYGEAADLHRREGWWMSLLGTTVRGQGYNIGPVTGGPCSTEASANSAAARRGKKHTDEARAKMSASQKASPKPWLNGRPCSPETRAKVAAANTGYQHTDEAKAKMSAARKGKPRPDLAGRTHTDEAKAKMSAARKGKPTSEETKAKMSAAMTGRPKAPEQIEKMAATKRGVPLSEEHKAKLSEAHTGKTQSAQTSQKRWETIRERHGEHWGPKLGKQHSEETKAKMSAARKAFWDAKKAAEGIK